MTDDQWLAAFLGEFLPDPEEPTCPECGMTGTSIFVCSDDWHDTVIAVRASTPRTETSETADTIRIGSKTYLAGSDDD